MNYTSKFKIFQVHFESALCEMIVKLQDQQIIMLFYLPKEFDKSYKGVITEDETRSKYPQLF